MPIEWYSSLETGNVDVDLQHKFFVNIINRIDANIDDSEDTCRSHDLLMELKKYAEFHFCSEENIAKHLKLSGLNLHQKKHIELLDEISNYEKEIKSGTKSLREFMKFLNNWFIGHTFYEDQILFGSSICDETENK